MKKIPGDINRGIVLLTAARPKKLCQANGSVLIIVFFGLIFISMKNAVIFGGDRRFLWKEKNCGLFW